MRIMIIKEVGKQIEGEGMNQFNLLENSKTYSNGQITIFQNFETNLKPKVG
jgi:hypothetical protein